MHSPDPYAARRAPYRPLLAKELGDILGGRALWVMLLLLCPLIGYSFFQAVSLYAEASQSAQQSPALAVSLSPLDGIFTPTLGSFYVGVTLLFPFVAIRALGHEKESGALRLLIQLPYRPATLIAAKLVAVLVAWFIAALPALSALAIWSLLGGHLAPAETLNLLSGQLFYGLLIGAIALFAASICDSASTAAIVTLAFTIGSWVLDFTLAGVPGLPGWIAKLSLSQALRPFEQGLLSVALVVGIIAAVCGFAALAAVWLPPGVATRTKLMRSLICVAVIALVLLSATQIRTSVDVTEDRRNSFPMADQHALARLTQPLAITVHLAPEDPRYADLSRNVLAKLERTMPDVAIRVAGEHPSQAIESGSDRYGAVDYDYGGRTDTSRSTSPREILPLLYGLAGMAPPAPVPAPDYPGYPLVATARPALAWFFAGLPLLIGFAWWRSQRSPHIPHMVA